MQRNQRCRGGAFLFGGEELFQFLQHPVILNSPSPLWGGARGGGLVVHQFARSLRNNATEAERKLWQQLRLLKAEGFHFRRQVPIGTAVADFACYRAKLVIELDGGQHSLPERARLDAARTAMLSRHGFRVIRFWNIDVFQNMDGVVTEIRLALGLKSFC
jgi:very-short-patch-repair endonuclease